MDMGEQRSLHSTVLAASQPPASPSGSGAAARLRQRAAQSRGRTFDATVSLTTSTPSPSSVTTGNMASDGAEEHAVAQLAPTHRPSRPLNSAAAAGSTFAAAPLKAEWSPLSRTCRHCPPPAAPAAAGCQPVDWAGKGGFTHLMHHPGFMQTENYGSARHGACSTAQRRRGVGVSGMPATTVHWCHRRVSLLPPPAATPRILPLQTLCRPLGRTRARRRGGQQQRARRPYWRLERAGPPRLLGAAHARACVQHLWRHAVRLYPQLPQRVHVLAS